MRSILIIQTAFIGDVVLATAMIEKVHRHYPDASIDFLLRKGNDSLLKGHPHLRNVLIWDKKKAKYFGLLRLLFSIRKHRYDVVVNVQRYAATGILTAFSGARQRIGFRSNPLSFFFTHKIEHVMQGRRALHETTRNQQLIKHLTDEAPEKPMLYPAPADWEKVKTFKSKPYVCLAPASVWFTKQYPAEQWIKLINELPRSLNIFLIGAPGDQAKCESIRSACHFPDRVTNLCGQLGYLASAALQKDAVRNFVNDSAPLHFASAMNAPVTAIYCSTKLEFGYGPLSDDRAVIETREELPCRPCGLHGRPACPEGHFRCAWSISEEQLIDTLG